ncbi:class I SAM-dependent methyltransferase [Dyella japonica]|uniref:SAM-dependent methyltransferase n=1 Tax=Dyella japonica TaxID=231455 RepID=A0ABV2JUQ0_9GAMM
MIKALDMVGSDLDQFECPRCGSHDRERHLFMYMQATGMFAGMQGKSILHFAPEKRLAKRLIAEQPGCYMRCDLYPQSADVVRMDMLAMDVPSDSIDLLIANHVLEHVNDYETALSEILRVLKPEGYAILQTPYAKGLAVTWQDEGIDSDEARLQAYGQKDHVRLFGKDIFARIVAAGFDSCVLQHDDVLRDTDAKGSGVNIGEPFFLFRKPPQPH